MNPTMMRACSATLLLGTGWAFGYFVGGGDRSRSASRNSSSATPLSAAAPGRSSASLSASAIGRLVEGKSEFRRQVSLGQYADSLNAAEMPGAVNEAMQLPLRYRNGALATLLARWADLDPAAAAAYVNLLPESADPSKLRQVVMTAWAEKDFTAALAWVRGLEKGSTRTESLTLLAGELAKSDPAGAMKLIEVTFIPWQRREAYAKIFTTWTETDFAAALSAAREIPDINLRSDTLRAVLVRHAETDPRAVLDFARHSKESNLRWGIANIAGRRWFERDFAPAREYALALPSGDLRYTQMRQMGLVMAQTDPKGALAEVDQFPEKDRSAITCDIFENWTLRDPAVAVEAVRAMPEGDLRNCAVGRVAQSLIWNDAKLAFALVDEIPDGEFREGILSSISNEFAERDPARAVEWYSEKALGEYRKDGIERILAKWGQSDAEAALEWTSARPYTSEFRDTIQHLAREFAGDEPQKAASHIERFPIDVQRAAVRGIAQRWSYTDAEAAANWALELRDGLSRTNAIGAIAGEWGNREPESAAKWIETLPAGPDRDEAVSNFTQYTVNRDPEGAIAWVATIQNPSKQEKAMREVFGSWVNNDPKAAGNWLQSTQTISADFQKELQTILAQKAEN